MPNKKTPYWRGTELLHPHFCKCRTEMMRWAQVSKAEWPDLSAYAHGIHGTGIFTYTWMIDFHGINVGKSSSPMDRLGHGQQLFHISFVTRGDLFFLNAAWIEVQVRDVVWTWLPSTEFRSEIQSNSSLYSWRMDLWKNSHASLMTCLFAKVYVVFYISRCCPHYIHCISNWITIAILFCRWPINCHKGMGV